MNQYEYRAAIDAVQFRADFQQQAIETLSAAVQQNRKETNRMKTKRVPRLLPIAAIIVLILAITATAATILLRPSDVAAEFHDAALAAAFESDDAVIINESVESEGYLITLAGMVSGAGLSDFAGDLDMDRTYVVVSVARTDGTPVEADTGTVATPLISGYAPHAVNAWTLGGGFGTFARDGIAYYLFDYQSLELFADHTVYLAVYEGFAPSSSDFILSDDGTISISDSMTGPHALFTLPMDSSKADPAAVEAYFAASGIDKLLDSDD